MSDNLTVFGVDYTNVAGIKAHATSDSSLVAYIRPSGTKSIAANGTGIDVTEYASVDVAVPAQDNSLIVTLSWDDDYFGVDDGAWVPDCTIYELQDAYAGGKEIAFVGENGESASWYYDDDYAYVYSVFADGSRPNTALIREYLFTTQGIVHASDVEAVFPNFDSPTRTYTPSLTQQTETITYDQNDGYNGIEQVSVTVNAMPSGSVSATASKGSVSNHSVSVTPTATVNTAGYLAAGSTSGTAVTVSASELVSGNYSPSTYGVYDVTNYATCTVAGGSEGTPTATKSAVSNHSVSVTPSVTNIRGFITGSTKTGTAVTVSASELVSGTKSITANGTDIDVTEYASVDVAVPAQDNTFVVSLIPNASTERFEPDCTYAEALAAIVAGKEIVTKVPPEYNAVGDSLWDSSAQVLMYSVFYSYDSMISYQDVCTLSSSGISLNYRNTTYHVNGDYYITSSGTHDVTKYASAHVAAGSATASATKGTVSNHSVTVTPSVTRTKGYVTAGTDNGTAVTVSASELVSGTYTVTGSGTADVTNYASASVAAGGATASATKGTVSNHSIAVTPSVTRAAGWVTAGTASGTPVTVSASELVSGSETKTANGTYDVTNLASVVVDVQGGSGDLMIATATSTPSTASHTITFTGLSGEPTSFHIVCQEDLATASQVKVAAVAYDGTDHTGQTVTNTSNAQASFDDGFSHTYSNGTLTVTATTAYFQAEEYALCYTYGGGSANIGTKDVQVGSGATSITFTGLSDEPSCWSCVFTSNFSTSSGYTRAMAVANDGTGTYGIEMGAGAQATEHWTATYSNGSLTITSQSTSSGGYFHQPGNYHLTYAVGGKVDVTIEPLTVTQNGTYAESGKAYSPVTVNVSGGGSTNVAQTTWTNSSTSTVSHQFTNLSGTPKFAVLRCTSQLTRSSSNTYYYIADIIWDGTDAWGNYHLRSNGTFNDVSKTAASGFNVSTGTNSITFSSDSSSRSSAPGAFYNGTYELTYVY